MLHLRRFLRLLGIELVEVSARERLISAAGGFVAILALMLISTWALPGLGAVAVVGAMGASAVLLFAMPHGPLSQPWPVLAGHGVSAFIGVLCARFVHSPALAASLAVGLSIAAMHAGKCIHPPGGGTAFAAVLGGQAVHQLGFGFVLVPVLANALVLVLAAVAINAPFPWRRYPAALQPARRTGHENSPPTHEEIVAAVRSIDSFVDVSEDDLRQLVEALSRRKLAPTRLRPVRLRPPEELTRADRSDG